jgi:hypothetical protein
MESNTYMRKVKHVDMSLVLWDELSKAGEIARLAHDRASELHLALVKVLEEKKGASS